MNEELAIPTRKNTITYDELRQKNRDEYAKSHNQAPRQTSPPYKWEWEQEYFFDWKWFLKKCFRFHSQGTDGAANITPPIGSYNPTLDSDRRRNFRTRGEDEAVAGQSGPKNRYGTYIFLFHFFFSHRNLMTLFVFLSQVIRGPNNIENFVATNRAIVSRLHE